MSALVTEVLEREHSSWVDPKLPQASPAQSVSEFAASEFKANEETAGKVPDADGPAVQPVEEPMSERAAPISASEAVANTEPHRESLATECRVCGRPFLANEAFCGNCSMPRVAGAPAEDLQSKWASLWYMQKAQSALEEREPSQALQAGASYSELQTSEAPDWQDEEEEQEARPQSVWRRPERVLDSARPHQEPASIPDLDDDAIAPPSWDDSIRAVWSRTLQAVRLQMRRRDTAIVMTTSLALILLLVVWAWPTPASPHLTWFESVLVELGLAQVPSRTPAPPTGNPDVRVWVDVHTALYYCPGSDLYGKTPGGQFETQHDAQQDQFEPATGVVCE
jgi:hypothetical protein